MARLKVFGSRQGFYDTVVAASSQKAALAAWGAHQDLFGQGGARVEIDPEAVRAALARPGEVLQRPAGTASPFVPAADAALPEAPKITPRARSRRDRDVTVRSDVRPRPPPDRSALAAAEDALAAAESRRETEQSKIDRERAALDARELDLHRAAESERRALQRNVDKARIAYERAGGRD